MSVKVVPSFSTTIVTYFFSVFVFFFAIVFPFLRCVVVILVYIIPVMKNCRSGLSSCSYHTMDLDKSDKLCSRLQCLNNFLHLRNDLCCWFVALAIVESVFLACSNSNNHNISTDNIDFAKP